MGYSARVVKEFVCEYVNNWEFYNQADNVLGVLTDFDVNVWTENDCNANCNWEIEQATFEEGIAELEKLPPNEVNDRFSEETNEDDRYTNGALVEIFKEWMKYSDAEDKVIRIHWLD